MEKLWILSFFPFLYFVRHLFDHLYWFLFHIHSEGGSRLLYCESFVKWNLLQCRPELLVTEIYRSRIRVVIWKMLVYFSPTLSYKLRNNFIGIRSIDLVFPIKWRSAIKFIYSRMVWHVCCMTETYSVRLYYHWSIYRFKLNQKSFLQAILTIKMKCV